MTKTAPIVVPDGAARFGNLNLPEADAMRQNWMLLASVALADIERERTMAHPDLEPEWDAAAGRHRTRTRMDFTAFCEAWNARSEAHQRDHMGPRDIERLQHDLGWNSTKLAGHMALLNKFGWLIARTQQDGDQFVWRSFLGLGSDKVDRNFLVILPPAPAAVSP